MIVAVRPALQRLVRSDESHRGACGMKECLVDVLNARETVLHVFPIAVEDQDGTPKTVDPEREALKLATLLQLVPEAEIEGLHARPHVGRGGQLMPYSDALNTRCQMEERAEQRIRERAYFLWQQESCPENRAEEYWRRACEIEGNTWPVTIDNPNSR